MFLTIVGTFFAIIMLAAFFRGLRAGVATLVFIRPLCDPFFGDGKIDIGGQTVTYGALINIVVIFALLFNFSKIWPIVPAKMRTIWLPYLAVAFAAVLYSPIPFEALRTYLTYASFFAMFLLAFAVTRSERDFVFFLKLMISSSVIPVVYGMAQLVTGFNLYEGRIQSTFAHPNIFAFFIVMVIGIVLFLQSTNRIKLSGQFRLRLLIYLLPLVTLLLFTKTRSAWVGCAIELLAYGIFYDRKALVLLALAPFVVLAIPGVSDRIADLSTGNDYIGGTGSNLNAYAWRMILWESSFTFIWQKPLFGYGIGTFHLYSPQFFVLDHVNAGDAHSVFVQTIFEMGFVGLAAFALIFFGNLIWLAQFWPLDKRGIPVIAAIMIAYLDFSYSDNVLGYLAFNWPFWFLFGLILSQFSRDRASRLSQRLHHWQTLVGKNGIIARGSRSPSLQRSRTIAPLPPR
jgi:O-antigen ligase